MGSCASPNEVLFATSPRSVSCKAYLLSVDSIFFVLCSLFFRQIRKEHSISHRRGTAAKYVQLRSAGGGAVASFLAVLGPGLLAGLSDDDPAGITTAWSSSSDSGS